MIENILKYLFRGIIYSAGFAVVGCGFAFFKGWQLLKGAYIFVLGAGLVTMAFAVIYLVGTPKIRRGYFARKTQKDFKDPIRGGEGIGPAVMGIVMVIIGFFLEALMH